MRFSTVFISCVFVLAGTSTGVALPVGRENMLMARFTGSYSIPEVEARAYNMEADSYTHGDAVSENNFKPPSRRRRSFYAEPPRFELTRRKMDGRVHWEIEAERDGSKKHAAFQAATLHLGAQQPAVAQEPAIAQPHEHEPPPHEPTHSAPRQRP